MGLYGVMRSSVSGMNSQSSKLGTVSDNIINANTTGYKKAETEFKSVVTTQNTTSYNSGGVEALTSYDISTAGNIDYTTSVTDLAIDGSGFFVVSDSDGTPFLTRAGHFVPDSDGNLVNTAGYYLQGFDLTNGSPSVVANALTGLEKVNINQSQLEANATTEGSMSGNLPSNAAIEAAPLPSANDGTISNINYTAKTSLVSYDDVGNEVQMDVYFTKTGTDTWEVAVFNNADSTDGGFPYTASVTTAHGNTYANPMSTTTLNFNADGTFAATSPTEFSFHIPDHQPATEDATISIAGMTQLAADFGVDDPTVNGNAPQNVESVEINPDGTLYMVYEDGSRQPAYRIPIADVASEDNLAPMGGEVFTTTNESGDVQVGFPGDNGMGTLISSAIEGSNVDLAEELTNLIVAQRSFSADSKVFQTGSDLLSEVVNLAR
ncbi:flagellar hook protein FlgE [Cohaesibacter marisflavi]|uniref:Flagellar hook protein FlgE n=1 Tax=Cohaesibacter marisflavi TaxID=655353 RepID=A0A1I5C9V3_9HYPH|nr:flagellar hook protein FlgE [Cohaesibacter marisflavi]SFN83614.1 flagellar hook protein FlgE [Cohaesibacter marisflavi]